MQDPDVSRIFREGTADRSALSADDIQRFDFLVAIAFTGSNQECQFVADGVIGRSVWENRVRGMRRLLPLPGVRQWWTESMDLYPEEFQNLVAGLTREGEAAK